MISLGNIALSLKDRVIALKSDYIVYFSLSSSFFGSKSFLRLVLLLTQLFSLQGLSVLFACVGSGDPVRVLRLYTTNTLDIL